MSWVGRAMPLGEAAASLASKLLPHRRMERFASARVSGLGRTALRGDLSAAAFGICMAFAPWCRAEEPTNPVSHEAPGSSPAADAASSNDGRTPLEADGRTESKRTVTPSSHQGPPNMQLPLVRRIVFTSNDSDAVLQLLGEEGWYSMCRAPCTVHLGIGASYRVSGPGISASRRLVVGADPNPIFLRADTGSTARLGIGVTMTAVGGLAVLGGFAAMLRDGCVFCDEASRTADQKRAEWVGAIVAAAGGGLLAGGIVLIVHSKTRLVLSHEAVDPPNMRLGRFELSPAGIRF